MAGSSFRRVSKVMVALAALSVGCSKKPEDKAKTSEPVATPSAEVSGDDSLRSELNALATKCEVIPASSAMKCKSGEQRRLVTEFARKSNTRVEAIPTLTAALKDEDPKLQTVTANILHLAFRSSLGTDVKPGAISADDGKAFIEAVAALPKPQATHATPAATHVAMISGQQEALYKMLEARQSDKLPAVSYRYLMTHGRLAAFPKVKELTAGDQLDIALAAIASPSTMRNWSAEEQAELCPWAKDLLGDERPAIATRASSLLANCTGQYVDILLDKGDELLKAGKLSQAQITPFRDVCSPIRRKAKESVSDEQCERNRKFLVKVLGEKNVEPKTKVMALSAVAYQWPDADTLKLAQKYEKDGDKELARRAADTVKRLEKRIKN